MNRVERLVAELREAAARVTEARLAWEAGRLHVAELRARHAEALRAKEEIEEELLTGQSRRPLIDAAEAAAEAEDTADEHQRGPTAPAPAEPPATAARKRMARKAVLSVVTQPQAGTCHWDVHRWTLGTRLNRGAMVGTQIAATEAEARKLAKEAWGPAIVIGDPHRHGPHCGCPQPDDADEPAEAAEPPRPRSRPRSRSRSRSRTERRTS